VNKSKIYGLIGSTLSSTILFLVLWLLVLSVPSSNENEGFLVSFGDTSDAGGGANDASVISAKSNTNSEFKAKIKPATHEVIQENKKVFTQTESPVSISQQKEKVRIKNEEEVNKNIATQKRKEQEAIAKANQMNGLFGSGGSGSGSGGGNGTGIGKGTGSGSGSGVQGNPAGKGNQGVSMSLNLGNRTCRSLVKPNYPKDVEGKITVNIRVDENGVVTSTSIGTPTTISDTEMLKAAKSAAEKTCFNSGKNVDLGSITYNYKLQ
jgi:outer membrane biosynthesis protein TonB